MAIIIFCILIAVYVILTIGVRAFIGNIVFQTDKSKNLDYSGINYTQVFRKNKGNQNIEILNIPTTKSEKSEELVLYFHGNIGRLPYILKSASEYANVISPAYPGYSASEGNPTQEGVYETVDVAMDYAHELGYKDSQITVLGHSLGGFPAVYAATKYPDLKRVILVNTFYSIQNVIESKAGPLSALTGDFMNTSTYAVNAKAKIRQFNNPTDYLISYDQASKLFNKLASKDKKYTDIEGTHSQFDVLKVLNSD